MKTQSIRRGLLASTMIGGAALAALMGGSAIVTLTPAVAHAQDYTSGTLTGTVQGNDGVAIAGATVSVRSSGTGVVRNATTDADGHFRFALIPTGAYDVTVDATGYAGATNNVAVRLGGQSGYVFTLDSESASSVDDIVVTGVRPAVDFTRTTTGLTVDVDELIDQIPVARNITDVTLLAPGAVGGDSGFAVGSAQLQSPPALGGSGPAENAFYVNGLNITNFVNGLGGASVPFEFYKTVEVKTGGYSAEFGRATGAIINSVTKSGTNDFVVELHGTWAPDSLREHAPRTFSTPNTGGGLNAINTVGGFEEKTLTLEVGGPIIRDRLFGYGIVAYQDTQSEVGTTNGTYSEDRFSSDPFYGIKLDGYITNDHRLEFTYFDTSRTRSRTDYRFNTTTDVIDPTVLGTSELNQGGENFVGRYTGTFTDWLTVSAAYGQTTVDQAQVGNLFNEAQVKDSRVGQGDVLRSRQTVAATVTPFLAERKFYRADADIYFDLFGQHHVRVGYDHEDTVKAKRWR